MKFLEHRPGGGLSGAIVLYVRLVRDREMNEVSVRYLDDVCQFIGDMSRFNFFDLKWNDTYGMRMNPRDTFNECVKRRTSNDAKTYTHGDSHVTLSHDDLRYSLTRTFEL